MAAVLVMAGCGSSSSSLTGGAKAAPSGASGHGTVSVLYAGSLVNVMEHELGPAFAAATHDSYQGVGAGSTELVAQIKAKVRSGDVFISASPKADALLRGPGNGDWISWYATFAKAPLVIGYNPHSSFAAQFRAKPWYEVITEPGIRVGVTDPKLDPKGKLTTEALTKAAAMLSRPDLARALATFSVYPEEALVGRLEAGQLDAGFFYSNEASEQHIPTVPITPVAASATYTVAILKGARNPDGAEAFVRYLLGPAARTTLQRHGLAVLAPALTGSAAAVPAGLRSAVGAG
ncbi:MAG TPA: extracellular solute-binding protein [Solirubrobacteraceae bacterium]|nr:extracellular solute-binding protein [Solirubrobacteraceae bacterium]